MSSVRLPLDGRDDGLGFPLVTKSDEIPEVEVDDGLIFQEVEENEDIPVIEEDFNFESFDHESDDEFIDDDEKTPRRLTPRPNSNSSHRSGSRSGSRPGSRMRNYEESTVYIKKLTPQSGKEHKLRQLTPETPKLSSSRSYTSRYGHKNSSSGRARSQSAKSYQAPKLSGNQIVYSVPNTPMGTKSHPRQQFEGLSPHGVSSPQDHTVPPTNSMNVKHITSPNSPESQKKIGVTPMKSTPPRIDTDSLTNDFSDYSDSIDIDENFVQHFQDNPGNSEVTEKESESQDTPLPKPPRSQSPTITPKSKSQNVPYIKRSIPIINEYEKDQLLGHGANGRVYRAFNTDTGEFFAYKEVSFDNCCNQDVDSKIESLQREIRLMRLLDHENIVRYYGARKFGNTLHIFLEYIAGGSLSSVVRRFKRLGENICKSYTKQLLLGLDYLHRNRIVHRDIKGANVLVAADGILKLADFGASRQISNIRTLSGQLNTLSGTPHFMAPEVILQTGHGPKADIWSLGCTVMEMRTGKPPFSEYTTAHSVMYHIASTEFLPEFPDFMSEDLKAFLRLCFVRDPNQRASAQELLNHKWLKGVETPLERRMKRMGIASDSVNSAIVNMQTSKENRNTSFKSNSEKQGKNLRIQENEVKSNGSEEKINWDKHSLEEKENYSPSSDFEVNLVPERTVSPDNLLPLSNVQRNIDMSLNPVTEPTLNHLQDLSKDDKEAVEVTYDTPIPGHDSDQDIQKYLKKKRDTVHRRSLKNISEYIEKLKASSKDDQQGKVTPKIPLHPFEQGSEVTISPQSKPYDFRERSYTPISPSYSQESSQYQQNRSPNNHDDQAIKSTFVQQQLEEEEFQNKLREAKREIERKKFEAEQRAYRENFGKELHSFTQSKPSKAKSSRPRKRSGSTKSHDAKVL